MPFKDIQKRREYQSKWGAERRKKEKVIAFNMLGGKCKDCGISDFRVLQIDHKNPVLRKHGNSFESGNRLRQQIVSGKRTTEDLQLICANCHQIKTYDDLFVNNKRRAISDIGSTPHLQ